MIREKVYDGRDNKIDILLTSDGVAEDLSPITKVELVEAEGEVDTISSADHASWFDWTTGTTGKMVISLGAAGLTVGSRYIFNLILYDAANTNGINWGRITVDVK